MMGTLKVAVVLVTYNRLSLLKESVSGLLRQEVSPDAVYIVNNASSDGTSEYLDQLAASNNIFHHLKLHTNTGGAGGFSYGLQAAAKGEFDWYWLMDDDAEPEENALKVLCEWVRNKKENPPLAVTSAVVDMEGAIQNGHQGYLKPNFVLTEAPVSNYAVDAFEIDFFSFVGPMISHKVFEKIGFPIGEYFIWHDDTEYALRLRKLSKLYCIPGSRVIHKDRLVSQYKAEKSLAKKISAWKIPLDQQWKYLCGIRNKVHVAGRYAVNPNFAQIKLITVFVVKMLASGSMTFMGFRYLVDYVMQGLGKKQFRTITPAEWKSLIK